MVFEKRIYHRMKKISYQTNRYIFTAKNFKSNLIAVIQCRLGKEFLSIQTASVGFHFLLTIVMAEVPLPALRV